MTETIFYIIIGVIIFVWQIIKEAKKAKQEQPHSTPPPEQRQEQRNAQGPPPPSGHRREQQPRSFEELLKESREKGRKVTEEQIKPAVSRSIRKAQAVKQVAGEVADEEAEALKKIQRDLETARTLSADQIPSAEEQLQKAARNKVKVNKYAALFKNKESIRNVFVASEIFNRKHF